MTAPSSGSVLVVEDDHGVAGLLSFVLKEANFEVFHIEDGRDGLEAAVKGGYDVILLDIRLPGLDGLTLCSEAKKSVTTPILILSARGEDHDRVLGLERGADDYLGKPFDPMELVARVRALLRRADLSDWGSNQRSPALGRASFAF